MEVRISEWYFCYGTENMVRISEMFELAEFELKPRANGSNMLDPTTSNMLDPRCWNRLFAMLDDVGRCWTKFDLNQNFYPTSNISIVFYCSPDNLENATSHFSRL